MKLNLLSLFIAIACESHSAQGQDMFVYDQQSSDESGFKEGGAHIQQNQPFGQSFTPTIPSVGFIRLYVSDGNTANGIGATLSINLRSDAITGSILASSDPVLVPDNFGRTLNFFFPAPVPVTSGTTYYFQPVVQAGDDSVVNAAFDYNYGSGTAFSLGVPAPRYDLWFREGIVVPEPSSAWLFLVGLGAVAFACRRQIWERFHPGLGS